MALRPWAGSIQTTVWPLLLQTSPVDSWSAFLRCSQPNGLLRARTRGSMWRKRKGSGTQKHFLIHAASRAGLFFAETQKAVSAGPCVRTKGLQCCAWRSACLFFLFLPNSSCLLGSGSSFLPCGLTLFPGAWWEPERGWGSFCKRKRRCLLALGYCGSLWLPSSWISKAAQSELAERGCSVVTAAHGPQEAQAVGGTALPLWPFLLFPV